MDSIKDALRRLREMPPAAKDPSNPFRLRTQLEDPASEDEIRIAWGAAELPEELVEFWRTFRTARLFEDQDYGQWGLVLLSPGASADRSAREHHVRPSDIYPNDVVLGEFLGDQELLVLAPSEHGHRRALIALPLDARSDWYPAGALLSTFLNHYFDAGGAKFWERGG